MSATRHHLLDIESRRGSRRRLTLGALALVTAMLGGCTTIDHFGARSSHFNVETADSKSRSILTNIMRAAYGDPLIFSDISTLTGQGSASATLGANLPVSVTPSTATVSHVLNPSAMIAGQSNFNVTNLNTQEFYNGIQTPLSLGTIQNLIDAGYDPQLVLFLAVSDITVDRPRASIGKAPPVVDHLYFHNSVNSPESFATFSFAIQKLADAGFSTRSTEGEFYGPELTRDEVADPKVTAAILTSTTSDLSLKDIGGGKFQFKKKGGAGVCFDRSKANDERRLSLPENMHTAIDAGLADDATMHAPFDLALAFYTDVKREKTAEQGLTAKVDAAHTCGYKAPDGVKVDPSLFDIKLKTRSLEGIIQFLGLVARKQTGLPAGVAPSRFSAKNAVDVEDDADTYDFRVQAQRPSATFVHIELHGREFYLASDPGGSDKSTRVLQIITDLLALQSSAKNIPSPNVISVLGR